MAFDRSNLGKIAGSDGFSLYFYHSTDTDTVISTSGYFNDASDQLRIGDLIFLNADTDGTLFGGFVMVNANASGVVDVTDITGSSTDSE